ncbi:hypothetical protein [Terribacillus sp. JSM ZJ617]|uniref:oxidoreductase n=1 Tax=Terribacillus sp. JSM ZJ617 TaxID=3342119 RepID=UPI0035A9869C
MTALNDTMTFRRGLTLKNRVLMAPMTTKMSDDDGVVTPDELKYYQLRSGEVAAVITAAANVQDNGKGWEGELNVASDKFIPSLTSLASTIKRNQDYRLPDNLEELKIPAEGVKPIPMYLDDTTNDRLDELVSIAKNLGVAKVNRSSMMRHILNNLIRDIKNGHEFSGERETKGINLYLESGTMILLQEFIPFRDRNAAIELFIMKDYKLTDNLSKLRFKPVNTEQGYVALEKEAI